TQSVGADCHAGIGRNVGRSGGEIDKDELFQLPGGAADDYLVAGEQRTCQSHAEKTGTAGDHNPHSGSPARSTVVATTRPPEASVTTRVSNSAPAKQRFVGFDPAPVSSRPASVPSGARITTASRPKAAI